MAAEEKLARKRLSILELAEATLDRVRVPQRRGPPRKCSERLVADKDFDSDGSAAGFAARGDPLHSTKREP